MMVVLLMTRRRRRIGIPSDCHVHNVDLGRYDGGRRLRRGLYLLRATDRVAASFATPSRPTDLTFSDGGTAVSGRSGGCCGRHARRLHDFVPIRLANGGPRKHVVPIAGNELTAAFAAGEAFLVKRRSTRPHHQLVGRYRVATARAGTTASEHPSVVAFAENHAAPGVARVADFRQRCAAIRAFQATVVPIPIHRVKEPSFYYLAAAAGTLLDSRCSAWTTFLLERTVVVVIDRWISGVSW